MIMYSRMGERYGMLPHLVVEQATAYDVASTIANGGQ